MSQFERFVTEGNEKAEELAKAGAMLDEGFMEEARAETLQRCSMRPASTCLVEQWKDCEELEPKPKEKWTFVDEKSEETKHRTEWFAAADKYRCMRCGGGSKYTKRPRKCTGPKFCQKVWKNSEDDIWEAMTW